MMNQILSVTNERRERISSSFAMVTPDIYELVVQVVYMIMSMKQALSKHVL